MIDDARLVPLDLLQDAAALAEQELTEFSPAGQLDERVQHVLAKIPSDTPQGIMLRYATCRVELDKLFRAHEAATSSPVSLRSVVDALVLRDPRPVQLECGETVFVTNKSIQAYDYLREDWAFLCAVDRKVEEVNENFRLSQSGYLHQLHEARRGLVRDILARAIPSKTPTPPAYADADAKTQAIIDRCTDRDMVAIWEAHIEGGLGSLLEVLKHQKSSDSEDDESVTGFGALAAGLSKREGISIEQVESHHDIYQLITKGVVTSQQVSEKEAEEFTGLAGLR